MDLMKDKIPTNVRRPQPPLLRKQVLNEQCTDPLTRSERSERMSRIRSKHTQPELRVRHLILRMGYRYRLHSKRLPCRPDIVFPGKKKIILVHGCFWHRHPNKRCRLARLPKSKLGFWLTKLEGNRVRDAANIAKLRRLGWRVLTLWECEVRKSNLENRILRFLERV
jgi:DNA mismatch endonuclease (patch repair protein)